MTLPLERAALIEHLKHVARVHLERSNAGALIITLPWKDGRFLDSVSISVNLPKWNPDKMS